MENNDFRVPLVGESESMRSLRALIRRLAGSQSTVLITGESGTGKELVAQALHLHSPRSSGHFVPINCGAIPRELLESELFGHRKGSFTGAIADRKGRFELANGGTLFLDEIGDLPLDMQVKLLRVLQDRMIQPVGDRRSVPIDVRVVAATHKNLSAEVAAGRFREDLYYRINVLPLQTTPLRDRPEDVRELLVFYSRHHAPRGARPIEFAPSLLQALQSYRFPGNVRELSNLVDRFTTLFPSQPLDVGMIPESMLPSGLAELVLESYRSQGLDVLEAEDLDDDAGGAGDAVASCGTEVVELASVYRSASSPGGLLAPIRTLGREVKPPRPDAAPDVEDIIRLAQGIEELPPQGLSLKQRMIEIERSFIEQALARTHGNVSQTARLLSLQRTTLIEKMNKYDLRAS